MKIAILMIAMAAFPVMALAEILHVPDDYPTIQEAIDAASTGDTVLVAPDTYMENLTIYKSIKVVSADGPETTIIDGNEGNYGVAVGSSAILEGFTVTNCGNASSDGSAIDCGSSATIKNNIICDNHFPYFLAMGGGGIRCDGGYTKIINNVITGNSTFGSGGGIYCSLYSSMFIVNNIIAENEAGGYGGGVHCFYHSSVTITNNTIWDNSAGSGGGGLSTGECSTSDVTNTILWNNRAPQGNEIYVYATLYPASVSISYSDVEGGKASVYTTGLGSCSWGAGMIDDDPCFVDPGQTDLHITYESPCNDTGDNGAPQISQEDFEGDPRIADSNGDSVMIVDMGADEFLTLKADKHTISAQYGGTVNFSLDMGFENQGRLYVMLGGMTGTVPGTPLPGGHVVLPLNWDLFTDLVLNNLNTPFFGDFLGFLDSKGQGSAQLYLLKIQPTMVGLTMFYSFTLSNPFNKVSNPTHVLIVE